MRARIAALACGGIAVLALAALPSAAPAATCSPGPKARCAGADLASAKLVGKDLSRANLSRAKLAKAKLVRARLAGANLSRADLTRANLSRANLTRANLTRATLVKANLGRADLLRATLVGANLKGADLRGARLVRARLRNADLRGARIGAPGSTAPAAAAGRHLTAAGGCIWGRICGGNLSYADLRGATLTSAIIVGADMARANLSGARLGRAILSETRLVEANLAGADLTGASITTLDARGANLDGVILDDAVITDVDLSGASLVGVDLRGALLTNVDLRGANLSGANLSGVDLRTVKLDSATLAGANLEGAILPEGLVTSLPELAITAGKAFSATVARTDATVECVDVTTCSAPVVYGQPTTLSVRTTWAGFAMCPDGPVRLVQAAGDSSYSGTCTFAPYQGLSVALREARWVSVLVYDLSSQPAPFPRISIEWREPPTYVLVEPAQVCENATRCDGFYPAGASVKVVTRGDQPYYAGDDAGCTGGTAGAGFVMADSDPFELTCNVDGSGTPQALTADRYLVLTIS
ncbi:MAG: pentapeptide repeat-containing protein [Thermoleophilia bacterium]